MPLYIVVKQIQNRINKSLDNRVWNWKEGEQRYHPTGAKHHKDTKKIIFRKRAFYISLILKNKLSIVPVIEQ